VEQQWQKVLQGKNVKLFFRLAIDHVSIKALHVWVGDGVKVIWEGEKVV